MVKNLFKAKKGMASEMWATDTILFWLIYGIMLGFVAIYFLILASKLSSLQATLHEDLQILNIMQRFLKSPNCFIYNKDGIVLSRVIDVEKFNEDRLNSCYMFSDNTILAFRLTLNSPIANIYKTIKTKNWNNNREFEEKKAPKNALIYSENKLHNGEMTIEIQNVQ